MNMISVDPGASPCEEEEVQAETVAAHWVWILIHHQRED